MKILFVNSCIRENSRTEVLARRLLKKMLAESQTAGIAEVKLQTAALQPLDSELLQKRDALLQAGKTDDKFFEFANQFAAADKIIVAAPYYDLQFPSLLKIYLENICVCGITFKYSEQGIPVGLCHADELIYVTTAGGYIGEYNLGYDYLRNLCQMFFAIPKQRLIAAEGLDIYGNDPEQILREVCAKENI